MRGRFSTLYSFGALAAVVIMTSAVVVVATTTGFVQVSALTILIATAVAFTAHEITHPITWFGPIFWLYSAAYPMLAIAGVYEYDSDLQLTVLLHALAFLAFSIPLIACRRALDVQHWDMRAMRLRKEVSVLLLALLLPLIVLLILHVGSLGVATKRDLIDLDSGVVSILISALTLMTFVYCVFLVCAVSRGDSIWPIASMTLVCFGGVIVMVGERDYLLRALVATVLIVWDFRRKPRFPTIAAIGLLMIIALPWLQSIKAAGLGGAGKQYEFELLSLFSQEFRVAAQNTYVVLARDVDSYASPLQVLSRDLVRALSPNILGFSAQSTTNWFNEVIYFDVTSGRGFSLVGYGYLLGGPVGVGVLYGALGMIYRYAYLFRGKSYLRHVAYMLMVPLLMYVQRGDIGTWLAQMLRGVLLLLLVFAAGVVIIRLMSASAGKRRLAEANGRWIKSPRAREVVS